MNTAKLKKYAPQARRQFISAVSKQLNQLGIYSESQISSVKDEGSLLVIEGKTFDVKIKSARARLVKKVQLTGYNQLVEQVAYTWFNRLCAIRYMEIHNYLEHGFRVLSHPTNSNGFEILDHAQDAADELGLNRESIIQLKLAGNKDEELYRELLLGQCHKLHEAMPFLFDAIDDETELLLPDNLIRTDSILRGLVDDVPEEDWLQVEVIGWLYQFYISEKKDLVMGKVVKSEDIPAATQLFTPNWIVKYLVQNSVGRQWLQTYPNSAIKSQMDYYIEPAEQSEEVIKQLRAITPESIDPITIKVLDPACGSGHILIEAYNILKAIYEERGFRSRDIPKLILENNLYGLDIDDRAAQLSGFALMMMARDDDKRIFARNVRLNVLSLQESNHIDLPTLWKALNLSGSWHSGTSQGLFSDEEQDLSSFNADNRYQLLTRTLARFSQAKTFGSLIDVPSEEHDQLKELLSTLVELQESGDSMQKPAAKQLIEIVHQALVLSIRYDAVIANPPYMGMGAMNQQLKKFINDNYPLSKIDIYGAFTLRASEMAREYGYYSLVTMHSWMFVFRFTGLRERLFSESQLYSLVHLGSRAFPEISGEVVQACAFTFRKSEEKFSSLFFPKFVQALDKTTDEKIKSLTDPKKNYSSYTQALYLGLPGKPIIYWAGNGTMQAFLDGNLLEKFSEPRHGMVTSDNERFVRLWSEVSIDSIGRGIGSREESVLSNKKWFPYNKGGSPRKWYGNTEFIVNWENDGEEIIKLATEKYGSPSRKIQSPNYYFKSGITWSSVSMKDISFRSNGVGYLFDSGGSSLFFEDESDIDFYLGVLNSSSAEHFMRYLAPTININAGDVARIPIPNDFSSHRSEIESLVRSCKELFISEYKLLEEYIEFEQLYSGSETFDSLLGKMISWKEKYHLLQDQIDAKVAQMYGVSEEVSPRDTYYQFDTINADNIAQRTISYAVGCILGRYSLQKPGVFIAGGSYEITDLITDGECSGFQIDEDGIVPLTDQEWFKDDVTNRFREFVQVVWGEEHLQENLDFVAKSLCLDAIKPKKSESALETIRRYLSTQFYKDHLKTYKKRPIYWLFSSGKQKAFECLVYLHRYNEGTLSRMRTEYVTPLLGKYDAYAQRLEQQMDSTEVTSEKNQLKKELDTVIKKQFELREFDDKLKHFADMRISLDLDDGVKVNYGKFGDLLADVKAITGSVED